MNANRLIRSQSLVTLAAGMIYPYYLLFLKNLGNSYGKYGLAFAVFTLSSAWASQWLAGRMDRHSRLILVLSSFGMAAAMLIFPWVASYSGVILLQLLMGGCNAMQRMGEKILLADYTISGERGRPIAHYHFWTSIASGLAVILGGYLIDWLTIDALFYASGLIYLVSGVILGRHIKQKSLPERPARPNQSFYSKLTSRNLVKNSLKEYDEG